jgi:hypothetical protein
MELSTEDTAALAALRRAERRWHVMRWVILAAGLALLVLGLAPFRNSYENGLSMLKAAATVPGPPTSLPQQLAFSFGISASQGFVFFLAGFATLLSAIPRWKGDPARRLLLKLLNEVASRP